MPDTTPSPADAELRALADQCVMCGLCLPHCPTYQLDRHEAESPRGRIAIARQLASGQLPPTLKAVSHLDHCLACLSCEVVCPSGVQYEEILVRSRALLGPARPRPRPRPRWLYDPARLRFLARLGARLHAFRWAPWLARALPKNSLLGRAMREIPRPPTPLDGPEPIAGSHPVRGLVTLFPGCLGRTLERDTLDAAHRLLAALGYTVVEPSGELCCTALALHAGDQEGAQCQMHKTRSALEAVGKGTVLVAASGCLRSLRDHTLKGSNLRVDDVQAFIAGDAQFSHLRFRPLALRVAVMVPCSQIASGGGAGAIKALLSRIPGLEVQLMPEQPRCCGAAGSYFIENPRQADRLRSDKLDQLDEIRPDLLLTSNIGCRIFLDNGLRQRSRGIRVMHPLTLLASQLEP